MFSPLASELESHRGDSGEVASVEAVSGLVSLIRFAQGHSKSAHQPFGRRSAAVQSLDAIHTRILDLYARKIGRAAAETQYQVVTNQRWISASAAMMIIFSIVAGAS